MNSLIFLQEGWFFFLNEKIVKAIGILTLLNFLEGHGFMVKAILRTSPSAICLAFT